MLTTFNIKDETILMKLAERYNVHDVKYNIITENFVYYNKHGEKKHIAIDSLLNHMRYENLESDELYIIINKINSSYFPRRIRDSFLEFYKEMDLPVPRNIFITNATVEFHDRQGDTFYIEYNDNFDVMFEQARKYIK